ncbi:hypothetical protein GCM10008083_30290 [Ulvibacter litoralis]|nr:hypothetical protein GCM10008083_30290 [Ulvibacter litoralis]
MAIMLFAGSGLSLAAVSVEKEKKTVSQEITYLLRSPKIDLKEDSKANVTFTINDNHEVVVLLVETDNVLIESFIKSRLNYYKLQNKLVPGKEYMLPVLVKAE